MHYKEVKSLEDVREYVRTRDDRITLAWADMLFDMKHCGEEHTVGEFIAEADVQVIKGHFFGEEI